jgi:hypothetical protein
MWPARRPEPQRPLAMSDGAPSEEKPGIRHLSEQRGIVSEGRNSVSAGQPSPSNCGRQPIAPIRIVSCEFRRPPQEGD